MPEDLSAVYVAVFDSFYALSPSNGATQWQRTLAGNLIGGGGPSIRRDGLILVGGGPRLDALRPNGDVAWTLMFGTDLVNGSLVIDATGRIFVVAGSKLRAVSSEGTALWATEIGVVPGAMRQRPAVGPNSLIYVAGSSHTLTAVNPHGGEPGARNGRVELCLRRGLGR